VGTRQGSISVLKNEKMKQQVHVLEGHLREVSSLQFYGGDQRKIISGSLDSTFKLWCLEVNFKFIFCQSFRCLYSFGLPINLTYLKINQNATEIVVA